MKVGPEKFGTPPPRNFWNVRPCSQTLKAIDF
jgi:hypothetical protein